MNYPYPSKAKNIVFCFIFSVSAVSYADSNIALGMWLNYQYQTNSSAHDESKGDINSEALVMYLDHQDASSPWQLSSEVRWGPGGFTNPANNSSGDNFAIHKLYIARPLAQGTITLGKSQVPFGWKTANFWPGDLLLGGYGDQMDVGIKFASATDKQSMNYQLAYYHADDFGQTSTDSTDDNGHWGSATTYRKVQTIVANINYPVSAHQQLGLSLQAGKLQDLTAATATVSGDHNAINLHYLATFDQLNIKGQVIVVNRDLPSAAKVENTRSAFEVSYAQDQWFYYAEASLADSSSNNIRTVGAHAFGTSYDYGPGWFYAEYLWQDGYIDDNGEIVAGDFSALYLTMDYYF